MYYTGIGSRETPNNIVKTMRQLAMHLAFTGYKLRSGKADGADYAFQKGLEIVEKSTEFQCEAEIYIPWKKFNDKYNSKWDVVLGSIGNENTAEEIVSEIHPAWEKLSQGAKKLHTRNVYQVLGKDLDNPSSLLIAYAEPTKNGVKGGTNTAWQLAIEKDIPCFNLWNKGEINKIIYYVRDRSMNNEP